jgi:hypothetical protein
MKQGKIKLFIATAVKVSNPNIRVCVLFWTVITTQLAFVLLSFFRNEEKENLPLRCKVKTVFIELSEPEEEM